jgi:hypothetical protein
MVSWTWRGMCGSGPVRYQCYIHLILMMGGKLRMDTSISGGVVPGATAPGGSDLHCGTNQFPSIGITISVFGVQPRSNQ